MGDYISNTYIDKLRELVPIPNLEDCKSLLCIQPHSDDNEIGAGATIAKLGHKGCNITYLTVTDGRCGSMNVHAKQDTLVKVRRQETERVAKLLGVEKTIFLDLADMGFHDEKKLSMAILKVVLDVRPEFILTVDPYMPYEMHPDHRSVGLAASRACYFSSFPLVLKDLGLSPDKTWTVKGIAYYNTTNPNTLIDVDDTWDIKLTSIAYHASQFDKEYLNIVSKYLTIKAANYGKYINCRYAEGFKVLSPIHHHVFSEAELI
jgi:LmbE family N-acetylglucosaminyl deacetylase